MADNILFLNMSVVSSKCLFEVWLFNKDVTEIAMIAIPSSKKLTLRDFSLLSFSFQFHFDQIMSTKVTY